MCCFDLSDGRLDLPDACCLLLEELFQDMRFHSRVAQPKDLASRRFSGRRCNLPSRDPGRRARLLADSHTSRPRNFSLQARRLPWCLWPSTTPARSHTRRARSSREGRDDGKHWQRCAETPRALTGCPVVSWTDITPQQATAANAT
jgi:hypothetical protein